MTKPHAQDEGGSAAGAERELKFLTDRATFEKAMAAPMLGGRDQPVWRTLRTVYFDTEDGDLSRERTALRVRHADGGRVMGLKRASGEGGAFEREEIEVPIASDEPDCEQFGKAIAREIADITAGKPLAARFGSEIRRAARLVEADGAVVEVAFDDGFLFAGSQRAPTIEIELELKSGPPSALFDLGLGLVEAFPLRLGLESKAERAHALMQEAARAPVRASDPAIRAGMTLDDAVAAIARACLGHVLANLPALESGDRVEAVHQMRVGIRRLRSALDLFGKAFPTAALDALRAEGRRIGAVLGEARDWDVFVLSLGEGALARFAGAPCFGAFVAAARTKAEAAHARVAALVDDRTLARFALRVERLAAARGWREGADGGRLAAFDAPVKDFAAHALDALHRRMRRRGRGFRSLDRKARHRLRIAIKHLRYATEFFGALFDAKEAKRFSGKASQLQDALGELNDAASAVRLVEALGPGRDAEFARVCGLVAGWCEREAEGDPQALRKDWRKLVREASAWREVYRKEEPSA